MCMPRIKYLCIEKINTSIGASIRIDAAISWFQSVPVRLMKKRKRAQIN